MKIIILDFETGEVIVTTFDKSAFDIEDVDYFFIEFNKEFGYQLNTTNCQWMIVEDLKIDII